MKLTFSILFLIASIFFCVYALAQKDILCNTFDSCSSEAEKMDNKGNYSKAIYYLNKAFSFAKGDETESVYYNRGNIYISLGKYDLAINEFNQAIRLSPNKAIYYLGCGSAYQEIGEYNVAIHNYNIAIRLDPKYDLSYLKRGLTYYEKSEYDRAIKDYDRAIRLIPQKNAYLLRGNAYREIGNYNQAIKDYDQAIRMDSSDPVTYLNRGTAYGKKENYRRATADFNKALRLDPKGNVGKQARKFLELIKKRKSLKNIDSSWS